MDLARHERFIRHVGQHPPGGVDLVGVAAVDLHCVRRAVEGFQYSRSSPGCGFCALEAVQLRNHTARLWEPPAGFHGLTDQESDAP